MLDEWRRLFGTSAGTVAEAPPQFRESLRGYFGKSGVDASAYLQKIALEARRPAQAAFDTGLAIAASNLAERRGADRFAADLAGTTKVTTSVR